jgi:hypothetical protein
MHIERTFAKMLLIPEHIDSQLDKISPAETSVQREASVGLQLLPLPNLVSTALRLGDRARVLAQKERRPVL